ncbi:MAG: acetyl/propionyl/methylcrotonyl-CoA carboxylase subunit alpha [Aquabacterium sp.]|jgi:3-methylcrotonyl-CoA carboxylase alpha subunit|uniref:acetyl/propionyl/methylcrotonyl-CoA carboxylase subunit alpha n=1 Tax=Aquabacterium sp. TaxID=1872578 RepID=UPI002A35B6B2|nr:acetyl/propionyl/methylcrotonyl-CoA carboxylase subunit alpha [Aquabacterium sp.]MDX9842909.1 acetyl/propionyl/methylcrotonyl-CoA carboxylase subunit alpha [Aquabacterium sp.]
MFTKILIANRGEIACRVASTARRLGIRTVAVYSDADAHARHVQLCDEAVHIGGASPRESYLCADRILAAAQATGAQAVHPGYGFLSENETFAQACVDAGIAFIGPPPSAIAAMGSKSAAKALMAQAQVPLVPGYHGHNQDPAFLQAQADEIGYPVLIKASAGGGGKGMRLVQQSADFAAALASCQREAQASFGDAHVLIERYVTRPRHIEIQVFGDTHGHYVHLGERDCSVQRRHQKVLEEAPAPGMTPERRAQMGDAAIAAARSVGYVGAGTVEFICEQDGRFYFMEMNTRLQVEHPVTEAITGQDLVEWQLRVAAGEPLPLTQEQITFTGHAIEARICAENPAQQFLPATGTLQVLRTPACSTFSVAPVRIDSGVREGDAITPHYDSMIAKLIVHGDSRAAALARLDTALSELHITGLSHNVSFLRRVAATTSFAQADLDTALIEREHSALFEAPALRTEHAVAGALLRLQADEQHHAHRDPWSRTDHWRLHGDARRLVKLHIDGQTLAVTLDIQRDGSWQLSWDAVTVGVRPLSHTDRGGEQFEADVQGQRLRLSVYRHGDELDVFTPEGHARVQHVDPLRQVDERASGGRLTALMPGKVVAMLVSEGQQVKQGDALAVTEAMKMEHTLTAPHDGVVSAILCAVGDQLAEGVELLRLDATA